MRFDILPESVSRERWKGTIESTLMAPATGVTQFLGTSAYAVAYGITRTVIISSTARTSRSAPPACSGANGGGLLTRPGPLLPPGAYGPG